MHHLHPVAFSPRNVIMIVQCASDNLDFEWTLRTENLTEISPSVQPSKYTVSSGGRNLVWSLVSLAPVYHHYHILISLIQKH